MAFGIYVHIPYCLQLCPYCDFTKYEWGKTLAPENYGALILKEIEQHASSEIFRNGQTVDTIYFGGGTPSLLEPSQILSILEGLEKAGFRRNRRKSASGTEITPEITIEIDPATVDQQKLDAYLAMGINRFSVGTQTFNDRLLKRAGRKHSSKDSVELLSMLKRNDVNYSFDLLFALPSQTLEEVIEDVHKSLAFDPSHVSAYCLTVPEGHSMSTGRAPEDDQVLMFDAIETELQKGGIARYEISNFAKPGRESRHNRLYWTDQSYLGLGLSSHSYFTEKLDPSTRFGKRFWNSRAMKKFGEQIESNYVRPEEQFEILKEHQALTDFMHTSLRLLSGMTENALRLKFDDSRAEDVLTRLRKLENEGLVAKTELGFSMTREGRLLANVVFERLTYLEDELA